MHFRKKLKITRNLHLDVSAASEKIEAKFLFSDISYQQNFEFAKVSEFPVKPLMAPLNIPDKNHLRSWGESCREFAAAEIEHTPLEQDYALKTRKIIDCSLSPNRSSYQN